MTFLETVRQAAFLVSDGGIETCIAYGTDITLDPAMGAARLVEGGRGRDALEALYEGYLEVGRRHAIPMQVGTPTFRASPRWLRQAGLPSTSDLGRINGASFRLLARLREGLGEYGARVFIAGVVGPAGDAYRPEEALATDEAHAYHRAQAETLASLGVDLLYAPTFPAAGETLGVARAMAETGLPYVVSPIISGRGTLLDGTPLARLIERIDESVDPRPTYYTVSCVHPSTLEAALQSDEPLRRLAGGRLLGIKANASSRSPEERVSLDHLDAEAPDHLADAILSLRARYGLKVLGGCCGTDHRHIEALARRLAPAQ